jgi:hypothetical protein
MYDGQVAEAYCLSLNGRHSRSAKDSKIHPLETRKGPPDVLEIPTCIGLISHFLDLLLLLCPGLVDLDAEASIRSLSIKDSNHLLQAMPICLRIQEVDG